MNAADKKQMDLRQMLFRMSHRPREALLVSATFSKPEQLERFCKTRNHGIFIGVCL